MALRLDTGKAIVMTQHGHIIKVIGDMLAFADPLPSHRLEEDLGADSLDVVELVLELEDEFAISISDADGDAVKTVADVIALVDRLVAQR